MADTENERLIFQASNYREVETIRNPRLSCFSRFMIIMLLTILAYVLLSTVFLTDAVTDSVANLVRNPDKTTKCPTCIVADLQPENNDYNEAEVEQVDDDDFNELTVSEAVETSEEVTRVFEVLHDQSILEHLQPDSSPPTYVNKTIFFIITTRFENNFLMLKPREACSIESAARNNPNWSVVVYVLDATSTNAEGSNTAALKTYPNIKIILTTLPNLVTDTIAAFWSISGPLSQSQYVTLHRSDFLRFVLLWKYGGVYLDTDVITLKSFESLPHNFAVAFNGQWIDSAVISFTSNNFGHHVAGMTLRTFMGLYEPESSSFTSPQVLTTVAQELCGTNRTVEMIPDNCYELEILRPVTFYPINFKQISILFDEEHVQTVLAELNESYGVHLWAGTTEKLVMKVGDKSALGLLAERNCPNVYKSCGTYF